MKAIKLLGIMIVLIGAILLALNWGSLFPSKEDSSSTPQEDKIDVTAKCNDIRAAWAAQSGWNADLYYAQRHDIDQDNSMGLLSGPGLNTINNALHESATNKTCEGYQNALHASPFNDAELQRNYQGVKALAEVEKMSDDSRVRHILDLHKLYNEISSFVGKNHTITAHFNGSSWESFDQKQAEILRKARGLRSNSLFNELKHLPRFQEGTDESYLKSVTGRQRHEFYSNLTDYIKRYFNRVEQNDENKKRLERIFIRLNSEDSRSGDILGSYIGREW